MICELHETSDVELTTEFETLIQQPGGVNACQPCFERALRIGVGPAVDLMRQELQAASKKNIQKSRAFDSSVPK